jgi:hypothetical protein
MTDTATTDVSVEERFAALEARIDFLEKERPGRRMKPNITSKPGVCGINPEQDSKTCPDASIYRYQQGCQGAKCGQINRDYYAEYRAKKKKEAQPTSEAVVEEIPATPVEIAPTTPVQPPWASGVTQANGLTQEAGHSVTFNDQ